ncbi:hypothetical protein N9E80_00650 [Flavobacteriaceae bacterium]|nr:hypothetical protein [Flavobacteriaceae bacterium]
MKKITSFLILLITLNSFCQENKLVSKISEINDLYLNQKYDQVISESKKIFSEVYGPVDDRNKLGLIPLVANSHIILENYSKAIENYNRYKEIYLKFDIKGLSLKQKEKALKSVNKTIADLKIRIPENEIITTNPKNNNTQSPNKNAVELVTSSNEESDSKNTVELVTSSNGKSRSEAIKFALRDALEQSFGAFISSNTKIMNDEIVNDEIVSVSSGNILNYDVISESQLLNELYAVSVRSTVSLTSLTTYMQNKGHEISFSGESFGMKIKLQKLNEQSETKTIDNMIEALRELIIKSIDFKIVDTSEPVLRTDFEGNKGEELYNVTVKVSSYPNKNYNSFKNFMLETLRSLSMSNIEIEGYSKLKKDVYRFISFDEENINYPTTEVLKEFNPIKPVRLEYAFIYNSGFEFNNLDFKLTNYKLKFRDKTKELIIENLKLLKEVSSHNMQIISKGAMKGFERYFGGPNFKIYKINDNTKIIISNSDSNSDLRADSSIYSNYYKYPISSSGSWYNGRFTYEKTPLDRYGEFRSLRNHDYIILRSKKSLTKIDLFLQEIQDYIFAYTLEFGDSSWSPLYHFYSKQLFSIEKNMYNDYKGFVIEPKLLLDQKSSENINYYTPPEFGLPSSYNNWWGGSRWNNSYNARLSLYNRQYRGKAPVPINISRLNLLFFTNLIRNINFRDYNDNLDKNPSLYHVISLKLTLSELENIREFKVNNLEREMFLKLRHKSRGENMKIKDLP